MADKIITVTITREKSELKTRFKITPKITGSETLVGILSLEEVIATLKRNYCIGNKTEDKIHDGKKWRTVKQ